MINNCKKVMIYKTDCYNCSRLTIMKKIEKGQLIFEIQKNIYVLPTEEKKIFLFFISYHYFRKNLEIFQKTFN